MKKSISLILALMLLLGSLCLLGSASADIETWYVKTGNGKTLNVRDIETGTVIGRLPYGSPVAVEFFGQGGWAYILWGSYGEAKVQGSYLVKNDPGKYQGPTNEQGMVLSDSALGSETVEGLNKQYNALKYVPARYTVKVVPDTRTGTARLRWAPTKNSSLLAQLPANYELSVIAASSNWLMVEDTATGKIGFIATKYTTAQ